MTTAHDAETVGFGPLQIAFDGRVLRPRPWTTAQSEWAAEVLAGAPAGPVLELCAGAGQIGLLAVAGSARPLVCVDVDPVACRYARLNAAAAGLADRVDVRMGPMDAVLGESERFAVVVADPPWVHSAEVGRYPEDPVRAIDGGVDGLEVARTCVAVARAHLLPTGTMLLQLGTLAQTYALRKELAGRDLVVTEVRGRDRDVLARLDRPRDRQED